MPTSPQIPQVLRFGVFELDVRAGELRKRGTKLRLQGQPLQVLGALLKRPGDLVTREELRAAIWPAETFVDFDHSLHNAIARIRETLGDSAEKPRYIETLPRRGYRFIGTVERVETPEPAPAPAVTPEPKLEVPVPAKLVEKRSALRFVLWAVLTLVASLLVDAPNFLGRSAAPTVRSIAVLPLANFSGDPAQEYFADGMTDELITDLAKISGIRVISRTSVMKFKGNHREQLPEIAKALNVNTIVEGSVLRVGDKVRITAQLIDAPSDKHLWAESYERDTRDVLTLQDEVASTIAQQIDVELTPNEQARFAQTRPVNPAALEACLKGRYFLLKQTSDGFQKASEYFAQAIKIAPDFAVGYAGLAAVYVVASDVVVSNQEVMPKAKDLLATALRLDNTNADAHSLLGTIHWSYDYDWVASERENLRAIELAPSNADTHGNYGFMLLWQARLDEAERELKLAQE